jgi:hypothetical protein
LSDETLEIDAAVSGEPPTKRKIKRAYLGAEIGLSDAIPTLMFNHGMTRGEAFAYLGL